MGHSGQFKGGADWRGNSSGRPKGTGKDLRVQLNSDMVKAHTPIFEKVLMDLAIEARDGEDQALKRWYVKEFKEYFYGKPKTEIEIEGFKESPDLSMATDNEIVKLYENLSAIMNREVNNE